jgi:opacity protein-like surface antigen
MAMKKLIFLVSVLLITLQAYSQFEQKVSINIASGIFKTFGKKLAAIEEFIPMQMPNYKMGFSANGGVQFKISKRFSLSAEFGIMISEKWYHQKQDYNSNWLSWNFTDTVNLEDYAGENYLDIYNYSLGVKPKYYLSPGKKLNPYFFAGVNINWTRANFEDTEWKTRKELDYFPGGYYDPSQDFLEKSFGIGFNPGLGVEYSPNDKLHFYLESDYYLIFLNKDYFKYAERKENFNAFVLQAGLRLSFIKSKDL